MNTNVIHSTEYRNLPLASLTESKTNPRRSFEHNALHELAKTIQVHRVLSPLLVRPLTRRACLPFRLVEITSGLPTNRP